MKLVTRSRVIGLILLVIALLAYFRSAEGSILLGIMGIILLIAPTKHAQYVLDLFIESLTKWKTIITTALYDALYWLLLFGAVYFLMWQISIKGAAAQAGTTLTKEAMMQPDLVAQNVGALKSFITFTIAGAVIVLLFCFIAYTLSRGMIWATIANQKPNKKFFLRFLRLSAAWWAIWLPIFFIVGAGLSKSPNIKEGLVGLLFIAVYFAPIVYTLYMQKHRIGYSISNGVAWGIAKIHRLIVPYTFAFIIYVIIYQVFRLFMDTMLFKPVSMLFVVLYFAWLRTYLYEVIKTFDKYEKV